MSDKLQFVAALTTQQTEVYRTALAKLSHFIDPLPNTERLSLWNREN